MIEIEKLDRKIEEVKNKKGINKNKLLKEYGLEGNYYILRMNPKKRIYGTTKIKFDNLLSEIGETIDNFTS